LTYITRNIPDDAVIGYPTSNGLACAQNWEEAVLGGALELVERDAFTTAWYANLALPLIEID